MKAANLSPLDSHLGYWLRLVSNHVSQGFARKLAARGVTVAEWVVLRELYAADHVAPSRLAARMGLTRGAVSKLADRLALKAFIAVEAGEEDRRTQTLRLLPAGRKLVPALQALADRNDAQFFGELKTAERAELGRLLKTVARARKLQTIPIR